jgi:hypothetical protein
VGDIVASNGQLDNVIMPLLLDRLRSETCRVIVMKKMVWLMDSSSFANVTPFVSQIAELATSYLRIQRSQRLPALDLILALLQRLWFDMLVMIRVLTD